VGLTLTVGWLPRWFEYQALMGPVGRGTAFIANQSINGVLLRAWRPDLSGQPIAPLPAGFYVAWAVAAAALVAGVTLAVRRLRIDGAERSWTVFAIVLLALPLVQPFAWFHHFAAGLVAVVVATRLVRRSLLPEVAAYGLLLAFVLVSFVAPAMHRAARPLGGGALHDHPLLWFGTSAGFLGVILALACLSQARASQAPGVSNSS
jgi:hypothetical protein